MSTQTLNFEADVSRLLDIVANALYSNQDVFLRELISNAADACDKLRYQAIQKPELIQDDPHFRIHIYKDTEKRTLTLVDNGIGMSKKELIDNLGTIAKSGTAKLMEKMQHAKNDDQLKLIGQFGVGFYASFMVAENVKVISKKAGSKSTHIWSSDGRTGFDIFTASKTEEEILDGNRGTAIILSLKDEGSDFLLDEKIKHTVETYSDHIDIKILLNTPEESSQGEGQPINKASALWTRQKSEITSEQYNEFYKTITHGFDEPVLTSHWRAEGKIEFSALLFLPTMRPWDLYDPSRKHSVRLYVRRIFISDALEGLMYPWMRFVRGVIDSEDLPLNISRESLQYNPIIAKIRTSVTKRILSDLDKLSRNDEPAFLTFWSQFGAALKEGLYDAQEHRDAIFKVCRFYSTHENAEKLVSLEDYVSRMKEQQKNIYYISGENLESLKNSPQLEGFKAKNIEVLFLTDTVDDFWLQQVQDYDEKPFKSVTKGDVFIDEIEDNASTDKKDTKPSDNKDNQENSANTEGSATSAADDDPLIGDLISTFKDILKEHIDDVRISKRLTESPVCLVAAEKGVDMHMERVLKIHQQYTAETKPVLEINAGHPLLQKLAQSIKNSNSTQSKKSSENTSLKISDAAYLLLDQAFIVQGQPISDPAGFAKRMSSFIESNF